MLKTLQRIESLAVHRQSPVSQSCLSRPARRWSSVLTHDPLRVLFCGADKFSIPSLKALNNIRLESPDKVASIDVVCRPGKPVGRGRKQIRERNIIILHPMSLHEAHCPVQNRSKRWPLTSSACLYIRLTHLLVGRHLNHTVSL